MPPRSMVLKVVRGKILETLELRGLLRARGSVSELAEGRSGWTQRGELPREMRPLSGCQRT